MLEIIGDRAAASRPRFRSSAARAALPAGLILVLAILFPTGSLAAPARIDGRVTDPLGRPVEGARVSIAGGAAVTTGADGRFALEDGSGGAVVLFIEAVGFLRVERQARAGVAIVVTLSPAFAESLTVTGTRSPARLSETASSIAVLSRVDLESSAAPVVDQALRQVPGFTLFRRSDSRVANPTTQGMSLRGVGGSGASRAAVLDDGIPLNDPFGGWVSWGRVPRSEVERVEVLRGGASDLYGGSALAGATQFVRREPSAPGLRAELSAGSLGTRTVSAAGDYAAGPWSATAAGDFLDTEGYVVVAPEIRGPIDRPVTARFGSADATVAHAAAGQPRLFLCGSFFEESRENGTPLQVNDTRIRQLAAGADWPDAGSGSVWVRAYALWETYHQTSSAISADRASERLTGRQTVPSGAAGASAQWSRVLGQQRLLAGVEGLQVRGSSDETLFAPTATTFSNAGGHQRTGAVFLEDAVSLGARWTATAGARFDYWKNDEATRTTGPAGSSGTVQDLADRSEKLVSPRGSLLYRAGTGVTLSASGYRSFRGPTLNELYRSFRVGNTVTAANEALRAERLTGWEVGALESPGSGRWLLRQTFFWMETGNPITNVTISSTPSLITRQRQNLGRNRSRGVELDAEASLGGSVTVSAGYLFADSTVLSAATVSLAGLRIPQVPRHQGSLAVRSRAGPLTLSLQARAASAQFEDDQNSLNLAGFLVADARAGAELTRALQIFVACENIFDKRVEVGRTPALNLGPPRMARAGLTLRVPG